MAAPATTLPRWRCTILRTFFPYSPCDPREYVHAPLDSAYAGHPVDEPCGTWSPPYEGRKSIRRFRHFRGRLGVGRSPPAARGTRRRSGRVACRSGRDRRIPSVPRTTAPAPTSRSSPRPPTGSSCVCCTTTARRRRWSCARPTRSSGTPTCPGVMPGQRYGFRVHGPYAAGARAALQLGEAAARPVRAGDQRADRLGRGGVRLPLRRARQAQRPGLGAAHHDLGRGQPVLRLGRRPAAAHRLPPHGASTRPT